ncbi:RHS repeat-associated core domain-containing protein [Delftia acidovorans]|uniref:RHS repeat-associated core domain-containing protein n=1 Tax=Delftia acidovorans TaxID=80866 RepID=UPI003D0C8EB4
MFYGDAEQLNLNDPERKDDLRHGIGPLGKCAKEYNPRGIHQAIRLLGQHHDREMGLYYNRHRCYDPVVGSYINQDPIGLTGGANMSSYPTNPVDWIDPLGSNKMGRGKSGFTGKSLNLR